MTLTTTHPAKGAISTSHSLATEAGAAALEAGGNAIDAALAAAAALCVVYPHNVALGGDLVALVRSPDGVVRFLNATGTSPADQSLERLREKHGEKLPIRGIDTVTVPGGVRGWQALHEYGAKLSWGDHLSDAIRFAEQGVPVSRSLAIGIHDEAEPLQADAGCRALFFPNDAPLQEGDPLSQPVLAQTLRRLAEVGADDFYSGDIAASWIAGLKQLGSRIGAADAANYEVTWGDPLEAEFAGHRVLTSPPNTSGFMMLRALAAVGTGTGIDDPLGSGAGELAQAFRDANAVRAVALADPQFDAPTGEELISMVAPEHPFPGQPRPTGDTVGISAASSDGWAISFINSVFYRFGTCILEPHTGIIFQNRGTSFSLDPASPNAFAPGKRPSHTLMPVLVLRGDDVVLVPSSMGGAGQPQIHTHLLLRLLAGATPHEATHAPRWSVGEPAADGTVSVMVEADVAQDAQQAIANFGFTIDRVPALHEVLGHSNVIRVHAEGFEAASDPRSDGSAVIVTTG